MKITVRRTDLLSKLQEKLYAVTGGYDKAVVESKEFRDKAVATTRREASVRIKEATYQNGVGSIGRNSDGSTYVSFNTTIQLPDVPFVATPDDYRRTNKIEELQKAITTLEMSTDETLVITEKDNYFRYLS